MKSVKLALIAAGIVLSVSAYSQTDSTQKQAEPATTPSTAQPVVKDTAAPLGIGQTRLLVTPNFGPHYIAVLGSYASSPETANTEKHITITGDEENPGKIWIEGLADTKIYALRKEMAGTYKIPVQKANEKSIEEGTLVYDDNSKQINICLGCNYKDASPADVFTASTPDNSTAVASKKKKATTGKKIISFTGSKTDAGTAAVSK